MDTPQIDNRPGWDQSIATGTGYGLFLKPAIFKFITCALNQLSPTNQLQWEVTIVDHNIIIG